MAEAEHYRLHLRTEADSIAIARLFIATVLRSFDVDESAVGDAKLAVSELCSVIIVDAVVPQFEVAAIVDVAAISIEISPFAPQAKPDNTERIDIANALFPNAQIGQDATAVLSIETEAAT